MVRSKKEQSDHNEEVLRLAKFYKQKKFDVQADLEGWTRPVLVNHRRPDIIATKVSLRRTREGNIFPEIKKIIIEVETAESVKGDRAKSQAIAFKKAEREEPNTKFYLKQV